MFSGSLYSQIARLATASILFIGFGAYASAQSITAPTATRFNLNTANQTASGFVVNWPNNTDVLYVTVELKSPPAGTTLNFSSTAGLTAAAGYNLGSSFSIIGFTGVRDNVNSSLNNLRLSSSATGGTIEVAVTATVNPANTYYNPTNGHWYRYVSSASHGSIPNGNNGVTGFDALKSSIASQTFKGKSGYLVTLTSSDEHNFIQNNVPGSNILIALTDRASEGVWKWDHGPESNTTIRNGNQGGTNVPDQYNNWCTGEPNNWNSGENFAVTKWNGGSCWNDYGPPAFTWWSAISGYVIEWGTTASAGDQGWTDFYRSSVTHYTTSATKLSLTTSAASAISGAAFSTQPVLQLRDDSNNAIGQSGMVITLSLSAGATVVGTATATTNASGVATFTNVGLTGTIGTTYTLTYSAPGLTSVTQTLTATAGPANRVVFTTQPSGSALGKNFGSQPVVEIQDQYGNRVSSTASVTLAIGTNPGSGALLGTATINAVAGTASFSNLAISKAGVGYTITASSSELVSATSTAFTITSALSLPSADVIDYKSRYALSSPSTKTSAAYASEAASLVVVDPTSGFCDKALASSALTTNATQCPAGSSNDSMIRMRTTFTPSADLVGARLWIRVRGDFGRGGTLQFSGSELLFYSAIASDWADWKYASPVVLTSGTQTIDWLGFEDCCDGGIAMEWSTDNVNFSPASASVTVSQLTLNTPADLTAGGARATYTVSRRDAYGNLASPGSSTTVYLSASGASGAFYNALSGGSTITSVAIPLNQSQANFYFAATTPGSYSVTASDATPPNGATGLADATDSISVSVGAASQLVLTTQPVGGASGVSLVTQPVVEIRDAQGNLVTSATTAVTVAIHSGAGGTLGGTLTVNAVNGVATFAGVTLAGTSGTNYVLRFTTATGLTAADSSNVTVGSGAATQLVLTTQPVGALSGAAFTTQPVVTIRDSAGNTVTSSTATVTMTVSAGGTVVGTSSVNAVSGVATFTTVGISGTAGTAYTLTFVSTGLTSATQSITPTAGSATQLVLTTQPVGALSGAAFTTQPVVTIRDSAGNTVTSSTATVTMTVSAGGTVVGTSSVNAVSGVATFTTVGISGTAGTAYTLTFASTGLTSATQSITPTAGSATQLAFTIHPVSTVTGSSVGVVKVQIRDASGNVVSSTAIVSLAIGNNPSNATLGGVSAVAAVEGEATFANLSLNKSGIGYTFLATSGSLIGATSTTFDIAPKGASTTNSTLSVSSATIEAGGQSTIGVQLRDSDGVNLNSSGGLVVLATSYGTLSAVTDNQDGTYSASLSASVAGVATVTATLNGVALVDTKTVTFSGVPNLTVSKTPLGTPEKPLSPGTPTTYQIVISNLGTASSNSATIVETIAAGLQLNSVGGVGWECNYLNGQPLMLPAKGPLTFKCVFDPSKDQGAETIQSVSSGVSNLSSSTGIKPKGGKASPIGVSVTPLAGFLGSSLTTWSWVDSSGGNQSPPTSDGSCSGGAQCATNTATVMASENPTIEVSFESSTIPTGGHTRLIVMIVNATELKLTNLGHSLALPSGLRFIEGSKGLSSCNGAVSVSNDALSLSGGELASGGSCSFSAFVTSQSFSGTKLTIVVPTGTVKNSENRTNQTAATANLRIEGNFAVRPLFESSQGALGVALRLTVSIDNTGGSVLGDASFTSELPTAPGNLTIADEPRIENTCAGTVIATPKSNRFSLSDGIVPAGGCAVSVMVVADKVGDYLNVIPDGGIGGSRNGLRGKFPDGSLLGTAPGASARVNIDKPAAITGVFTKRVGFGQQVPQGGVTVVLKDAEGRVVATTVTKADGSYSFENLPPTLLGDATTKYRVEFVLPSSSAGTTLVKGNPEATDPSVNGQSQNNGITGITLKPGTSTPSQNGFSVDPSGVIYDSVTRRPVAGARVTLIGPDGAPVPNSLLDLFAGTANGAAVGSNGLYVLLLTSEAPSGLYRLRVDVPNGYQSGEATGNSIYIPAESVPYIPALGGGIEKVQPQDTAPTLSEDSRYFMSVRFVITDRPETSSNGIINNHIAIDPVKPVIVGDLEATKVGSAQSAELGDSVGYTITLKNATNVPQYGVVLKDTMPIGFKYIGSTSTLQRDDTSITQDDVLGVKDGERVLNYEVGTMLPGDAITLTYRARVGVGSTRGDGINRATASSLLGTMSNEARFGIRVDAGVFSSEACVIGSVYRDCNDNGVRDEGEPGVSGVRLYFSDGAYMVSDQDGRYSLCGRRPSTQALKVDPSTLPEGSVLGSTSNRDAGDPSSLFLDLKNGEMHRADFRVLGCSTERRVP